VGPACDILLNCVVTGQTTADLSQFTGFQYGGHQPYWISANSKF